MPEDCVAISFYDSAPVFQCNDFGCFDCIGEGCQYHEPSVLEEFSLGSLLVALTEVEVDA